MDRVDVGDQTLNQVLDANVMWWLRIWVSGPFVGLCGDNISFLVPCARPGPD